MMTAAAATSVSHWLSAGLAAIRREQLQRGEIATYGLGRSRSPEYRFNLLASVYVHDALSPFDPASRWFDVQSLDLLPGDARPGFARAAGGIRRDIRNVLAWQESADGVWCFHGRGSGLPPDLETTAGAAIALMDGPADARRVPDRMSRFLRADGWCSSPRSRGVDDGGRARVGTAWALGYLALAGADVTALQRLVLDDLAGQGLAAEGAGPWSYALAVARTWQRARLHDRSGAAGRVAAFIRARLDHEPAPDPVTLSIAVICLRDLDSSDAAAGDARTRLRGALEPPDAFPIREFEAGGYNARAVGTALVMSALARS
jgi:hypothetical protein